MLRLLPPPSALRHAHHSPQSKSPYGNRFTSNCPPDTDTPCAAVHDSFASYKQVDPVSWIPCCNTHGHSPKYDCLPHAPHLNLAGNSAIALAVLS